MIAAVIVFLEIHTTMGVMSRVLVRGGGGGGLMLAEGIVCSDRGRGFADREI